MLPNNSTELVRKDSIEELCGHRNLALQLYKQAMDALDAALAAHARACAGGHISTEFLRDTHHSRHTPEAARTSVDRDMWRFLVVGTPIGSLMDAEEKRKFEDQLKKDVPEITGDTVFATLARLAGDADKIFRRGLVNAFRRLSMDYRSHDGFKIGRRVIIPSLVTGKGVFRYPNHYRTDTIQDIDRCMHVLDGKPAPEYQQGLMAAIRTALSASQGTVTEVETPYYRVKWYGNGNAHLWFLRPDLVELANRLIAQHFGEALGAGPDARQEAWA